MKVCMVTSVHSPFDSRIFYREAKSLERAGYEVTVIAPADPVGQVVDNIHIVGIPRVKSRWGRVRAWQYVLREVKKLKPDIVHFHDPELLLIAPNFRPAKVIYDCHEHNAEAMLWKYWIPNLLRYPLSFLTSQLEPALARWTDAIVIVEDSQAKTFRQVGKPVVLLYNFPMWDGAPGSHINDRIVIHVGTHGEARGCRVMIEAIRLVTSKIPDVKLVLVGHFSPIEYESKVHELILAYGLENTVELAGEVPHADVPRWIARATVGIVALQKTSQFCKGIPTKLFEYMAHGIPVVASDLPATRRFMEQAGCGFLVEPSNPQQYADAIIYLLDHQEEAKRMGENGRQAVNRAYHWKHEEEKLLSLYHSILN
jgi:glycosyltransferase involved in cell wall biosynthesis